MKRQKVKFRWLSTLAICLIWALCIGISIPLAGCNSTEAEVGAVQWKSTPELSTLLSGTET